MRLAVLVELHSAPDPAGGAKLRESLARVGFDRVVEIDRGDTEVGIAQALADVTPGDAVLVHVSGPFGGRVAVRALAETVDRDAADALVVLDLVHDDASGDPLTAVSHVQEIRAELAARPRGASLVGVRAASLDARPLAFTHLVLRVAEDIGAREDREVGIAEVVDRLSTMSETREAVESYALVRGADFEIATPSELPDPVALLDLADRAKGLEKWDEAIAGYRASLVVSRSAEARERIYGRIAELEAYRGRDAHAERAKRKARAAAAERVDELFARAKAIVADRHDLGAAVAELEAARALDPARDDVLEALRRAYRVLERWSDLVDVTGALADKATGATERAARRLAQAKIALDHLKHEPRGLALLEAALEDDPTCSEALDALVELRLARGERELLSRSLERLAERLVELGDHEGARDATRRLAGLEPAGEVDEDESSAETLRREPAAEDADTDSDALDAELARAPLVAATHRRLFTLYSRGGDADRAYLTALALEELEAAQPEHDAILAQHRPDGLRVRATLDERAWSLLRAPGATDDVARALFAAVARPAIAARVDERRTEKKLVALDPARRQSESSTASIVRSFHWAARVLGVACPALYVLDRVNGDVAAVPAAEPSTALGPGVVRGLSTKELAFVTGRHVTYYRPEHAVLIHFPTLGELTTLVLAAVQLAMPQMPIPPAAAASVSALRARIARHARPDERAAIADAVARLDARDGRIDLAAWVRGVELTAARAGLLLCGDLRMAMTRLRAESRSVAGLTFDERRADLVAFCASRAHVELRAEVAITASTPPPPESLSGAPRDRTAPRDANAQSGDTWSSVDGPPSQREAG